MPESKRALKKVPTFKNEEEERDFWSREDSTEYVDLARRKGRAFPKSEGVDKRHREVTSVIANPG